MVKTETTNDSVVKKTGSKQDAPFQQWWTNNTLDSSSTSKLTDVNAYVDRIMRNQYIGQKAKYLVARDVFTASVNLSKEHFISLCKDTSLSVGDVSNYLNLGSSLFLEKLLNTGRLPMKWTVCVLINKQPREVQDVLASQMTPEITMKECLIKLKDITGHKLSESERKTVDTISFIKINLIKDNVTGTGDIDTVLNTLRKDVAKYDFVSLDSDEVVEKKVKSIKEMIDRKLSAGAIVDAGTTDVDKLGQSYGDIFDQYKKEELELRLGKKPDLDQIDAQVA